MLQNQRRRTILILSQVYVPDPASVGQHIADAASELARRGHRVLVYTADRGYDDPTARYPSREVLRGVEVHRLPLSSFGKSSIPVRLLGGLLFMLQALLRGLFVRDLDSVVVSTSPPMASAAGLVLSLVRSAELKFWVMDLNPDQSVALGRVRPGSLAVRAFELLNRLVLARAADVVVLDRFMAGRVNAKLDVARKLRVVPPWPHEDDLEPVPHHRNPFRKRHGLEGKFVVMYSGNHGPTNPLTTVLEVARRMADDESVVFAFIGGGTGKKEVEAIGTPNVLSLPYQPLSELRFSLSAADLHVVTMGNGVVGMVHPCKIYGAMAVGRPVLLLGPGECHVADLLAEEEIGWHVRHGDVAGAERIVRQVAAAPPQDLAARGGRARRVISDRLSKESLCGQLCDILESRGPAELSADRPAPAGASA